MDLRSLPAVHRLADGLALPRGLAVTVARAAVDQARAVIAVDLETGVERWRFEVGGPVVGEVVPVNGAIFVTTRRGSLFAIGGPPGEEGATPVEAQPFPEGSTEPPGVPDTPDETDTGDATTTTTAPSSEGATDDGSSTTTTEVSADDVAGGQRPGSSGRG